MPNDDGTPCACVDRVNAWVLTELTILNRDILARRRPPADWWAGTRIAVLAGMFGDGLVRTYTGTADERRFFELIKASEAIEAAVNAALMPLSDTTLDARDPEALDRLRLAAVLLGELRRLNDNFAALPSEQSLGADYFMDVFRQYAVH